MAKVAKLLSGILTKLSNWAAIIAGLALVGLCLIVNNEVISRYFFRAPTKWGFEVVQFLMEYICFLALAYTLLKDKHVNVDLAVMHLPRRWRVALEVMGCAIGLSVFAVITWESGKSTLVALAQGLKTAGIAPLPLWVSIVPESIGSFLMCGVLVVLIYRGVVAFRRDTTVKDRNYK